jgi:hypothetical protein
MRRKIPVDQFEERGFASAVAPKQTHPLALLDLEVDAVEKPRSPKAEAHIL